MKEGSTDRLEEDIREGFPEEVMPKQCCADEYLLTKGRGKGALRKVKRTG